MPNCYENRSTLYTEYFFKQLHRAKNKTYEFYVINRILYLLNDHTLKFVTQQYVRIGNKKIALTDLFFPQLNFHIEIDEGHHYDLNREEVIERNTNSIVNKRKISHSEADRIRQSDIVSRTGHCIERINVFRNLDNGELLSLLEINENIDKIVEIIKNKKAELVDVGKYKVWNIEKEFSPEFYISQGYIDADDDVIFLNAKDVCGCFNAKYNPYKAGGVINPKNKGILIWFPKLFENDEWLNGISECGNYIYEQTKDPIKKKEMFERWNKGQKQRLVFARIRNNLTQQGKVLFKFYGLYELHELNEEQGGTWKLISKRFQL